MDAVHLHCSVADGTYCALLFACPVCISHAFHMAIVSSGTDCGGCHSGDDGESFCFPAIDVQPHPLEEVLYYRQGLVEVSWVMIPQFSIIGIKMSLGSHGSCCSGEVPLPDDGIGYNIVKKWWWNVAHGKSTVSMKWLSKECLLMWDDHVTFPKHEYEANEVWANTIVLEKGEGPSLVQGIICIGEVQVYVIQWLASAKG